jgi:hypothetical protein
MKKEEERQKEDEIVYWRSRANEQTKLPNDLIMRLIKFVHPDRHNGCQEANQLTRELLELRHK